MSGFVRLYGGTDKFASFLESCGCVVIKYTDITKILGAVEKNDAVFILPDYSCSGTIKQFSIEDTHTVAELKKSGVSMYFENYMSYNFYQGSVWGYEILGDVSHVTTEVITADGEFSRIFGGKYIFQARRKPYFPSISRIEMDTQGDEFPDAEPLLRLGKHTGTEKTDEETKYDTAVMYRSGSIYSALVPLSEFDGIAMLPYYKYAELFGTLFGTILSIEDETIKKAFYKTYSRITTRMSCNDKIKAEERNNLLESTIKNAVNWHFDSGIIYGDISFEMIMSSSSEIYKSFRVDAGLYTGWLLCEAGDYFKNKDWKSRGKGIYDYFAQRAQIEGGTHDGMFKWNINPDSGPWQAYSIDCGRAGITLVNMYRLTGEESYFHQIRKLANGFMNWFCGDLLYSNMFTFYADSARDKPYTKEKIVCTPGIYAEVASFLAMASEVLGEELYARQCVRLANRLCAEFPNFEQHGHTTSSQYARFLLVLAAAHSTGMADYSDMLNMLLDYFKNIQTGCGGIYVEDNLSFEKYGGHFGEVTENGINAPWEETKLSDQLYCVNNFITALTALRHLPDTSKINTELVRDMLTRLEDYLIKIQICGSGAKYDGGWMRAYNMTHDEYYGMDLDLFWGPYCIMAGWTMGLIPVALLSELNKKSYYTVSDIRQN